MFGLIWVLFGFDLPSEFNQGNSGFYSGFGAGSSLASYSDSFLVFLVDSAFSMSNLKYLVSYHVFL